MRWILLLGLLAAIGCGKDGGGSSDSGDAAAPTVTALDGTWKSDCIEEGDGWYFTATMSNTAGSGTSTIARYWSQPKCLYPTSSVVTTRSFVLGAKLAAVDAYAIDYTYEKVEATIKDQEIVDAANNDSGYGYTDWVIDVAKDVTGKAYNDEATAEVAAGFKSFNIVKIEADKLTFGDVATGNMQTAETRPTGLSSALILTKQ